MNIIITLALLLALGLASKEIRINYNHTAKTILLYTQTNSPVQLHLSFQSKDFQLHESLKGKSLFLNKNKKYPIDNLTQVTKYDYKIKQTLKQQEDNIVGTIGIGQAGKLYQIVKQALNSSGAKLQIKHKEAVILAVGENCKYPLFLPMMITLSEANIHSYSINTLSTQFAPDTSFLSVLGKHKSPFQASKQQLQQEVTISLRDSVLSVPISTLLKCGKYSNSDNYQCEVNEHRQADVGGLLFQFDPTFCGAGIELDLANQANWEYHYTHLVLMILQFVLLSCLVKQQRVAKMIKGALGMKLQ